MNVAYEPYRPLPIVLRDLTALARSIAALSRAEKDDRMEVFLRKYPKYIMIGISPDGVIDIIFHRNMCNYLKREGRDIELIKDKILEFAGRRYGTARELR